VEVVQDPRQADWLLRLEGDLIELTETSGNRSPFRLPAHGQTLSGALRAPLEKIYRARNLIALANRFEGDSYRGDSAVDIDVDVLRYKDRSAPAEVAPALVNGWVFRPGDYISFRVHNKSAAVRVDVTLLVIGPDFEIQAFYPRADELAPGLGPGASLSIPPPLGEIGDEPPFGPECLVVIAATASNPPTDYTVLAQAGLSLARAADATQTLRSPVGQLLESAVFRTGARNGLSRTAATRVGMRIRTWRTEPRKPVESSPAR
jgi:hypothetical protein